MTEHEDKLYRQLQDYIRQAHKAQQQMNVSNNMATAQELARQQQSAMATAQELARQQRAVLDAKELYRQAQDARAAMHGTLYGMGPKPAPTPYPSGVVSQGVLGQAVGIGYPPNTGINQNPYANNQPITPYPMVPGGVVSLPVFDEDIWGAHVVWDDVFEFDRPAQAGKLFPLWPQFHWGAATPSNCHELGDYDMADARQTNPVIVTPTGILSFPNLFEKRPVVEGGEERFSANLVFDEEAQKTDAYKALQKAILEAAKKFFGDKMPKNMNWPLRDTDEKADKYAGYEPGKKFIGAWTKTRPGVIGPDKADVTDKDTVWAGQKARFAVRPFAYDKGGNKGVGLVLDSVQIVKFDCERIDGKKAAKDVFDDLGGGSSDGDEEIPF